VTRVFRVTNDCLDASLICVSVIVVAEDLVGVVPLVGGNWLASWGVAIAHDLNSLNS
jgi:hypothetical protein